MKNMNIQVLAIPLVLSIIFVSGCTEEIPVGYTQRPAAPNIRISNHLSVRVMYINEAINNSINFSTVVQNFAVSHMDFYVNNNLVSSCQEQCIFNYTFTSPGNYTYFATATNSSGSIITSRNYSLLIKPENYVQLDRTNPQVVVNVIGTFKGANTYPNEPIEFIVNEPANSTLDLFFTQTYTNWTRVLSCNNPTCTFNTSFSSPGYYNYYAIAKFYNSSSIYPYVIESVGGSIRVLPNVTITLTASPNPIPINQEVAFVATASGNFSKINIETPGNIPMKPGYLNITETCTSSPCVYSTSFTAPGVYQVWAKAIVSDVIPPAVSNYVFVNVTA